MPFKAAEDYACTVMGWAASAFDGEGGVDVERGVAYGPHRLHRYDVFRPRGARDAPVLVFWHGGGWTHGYREYNAFMAAHVCALGFVLISPSYRLVREAPLPAAYEDSLAVLAHVAAHAQRWGGDPCALFLSGHSAGGHLAALVALRSGDRTRHGTPQDCVRACVPISGIMDLHHPAPAPGSLEERVYTTVLAEPHHDAVMSPLCWTAGNRVPFSLWYGEHDSDRVRRSNVRMHELLKLQPGGSELHALPGHDHFQTHLRLRDGSHPWYARLRRMVEECA